MRLQWWQAAGQRPPSLSNENTSFPLEKEPKFSCWDHKCTSVQPCRDEGHSVPGTKYGGTAIPSARHPRATILLVIARRDRSLRKTAWVWRRAPLQPPPTAPAGGGVGSRQLQQAPHVPSDAVQSAGWLAPCFLPPPNTQQAYKGTQCWCPCCLSSGRKAGTTAGHAHQTPGRGQDQESPCTPLWNDLSSNFSKRTYKPLN